MEGAVNEQGGPIRFSRRVAIEQAAGWAGVLLAMTWARGRTEEDGPARIEPPRALFSGDVDTVSAVPPLLERIAYPLVGASDARQHVVEWTLLDDGWNATGTATGGTSSPVFLYGRNVAVRTRIGFDPFDALHALTIRRAHDEVTILAGPLAGRSLATVWSEQGSVERLAPSGAPYWSRTGDAWSTGFVNLDEPWNRMRGVLDFAAILDDYRVCFSSGETLLRSILDAIHGASPPQVLPPPVTALRSLFETLPQETRRAVGLVRGTATPLRRVLSDGSGSHAGTGTRLDGYLITESTGVPGATPVPGAIEYLLVMQTGTVDGPATLRSEIERQWERGRSAILEVPFRERIALRDVRFDDVTNAAVVQVAMSDVDPERAVPVLRELIGVPAD